MILVDEEPSLVPRLEGDRARELRRHRFRLGSRKIRVLAAPEKQDGGGDPLVGIFERIDRFHVEPTREAQLPFEGVQILKGLDEVVMDLTIQETQVEDRAPEP